MESYRTPGFFNVFAMVKMICQHARGEFIVSDFLSVAV